MSNYDLYYLGKRADELGFIIAKDLNRSDKTLTVGENTGDYLKD